jgi:hypothetical protein
MPELNILDLTVRLSSKISNMADGEAEHTWACSKWDWSFEKTDWKPSMSKTRTIYNPFTHADFDKPVLLDTAKGEQYDIDEGFGAIIEEVLKAQLKIEQRKVDYTKLDDGDKSWHLKQRREALAALSSAHADLELALGVLVAAQKRENLKELTVNLTEKWQATVWNSTSQANRDLARYDEFTTYKSALPREDGWVGSWPLGSGSYGATHLFVRQDRSGQICNRVVTKDCDYNRPDRPDFGLLWSTAKWFWRKDHRDKDIPTEVKAMSDLRGKIGSEFVVKILNWRIAEKRKFYRLYLEVYI